MVECPSDFKSIKKMATIFSRKFSETNSCDRLSISIKINLGFQGVFTYTDDELWDKWNFIRKILQSHANLSIALELLGDLPDDEQQSRWFGEPISWVILPTSIFITNNSNYPVLSKALQIFLGKINFHMAENFAIVIKGNSLHGHIKHYSSYINHLKGTELFENKLAKFCSGYEDFLQIPLQVSLIRIKNYFFNIKKNYILAIENEFRFVYI